jgi:hypothetical protein
MGLLIARIARTYKPYFMGLCALPTIVVNNFSIAQLYSFGEIPCAWLQRQSCSP